MKTKCKLIQRKSKKQLEKRIFNLRCIQILLENVKTILEILFAYWFIYFLSCTLEILEILPDTDRLLEFSRTMWTANTQGSVVAVVYYLLTISFFFIGLWRSDYRYVFTKFILGIAIYCSLLAVLQNQPLISGPDAFFKFLIIFCVGNILVNVIKNLIGMALEKYEKEINQQTLEGYVTTLSKPYYLTAAKIILSYTYGKSVEIVEMDPLGTHCLYISEISSNVVDGLFRNSSIYQKDKDEEKFAYIFQYNFLIRPMVEEVFFLGEPVDCKKLSRLAWLKVSSAVGSEVRKQNKEYYKSSKSRNSLQIITFVKGYLKQRKFRHKEIVEDQNRQLREIIQQNKELIQKLQKELQSRNTMNSEELQDFVVRYKQELELSDVCRKNNGDENTQ